jgi:RpiR family carbohydrate utilization transcriptional regulator
VTVASMNGDGVDDRFFELVAARRPSLPPSERRVADFVLGQPERIVLMSIGALAEAVGVSQPTVLRFARALGLTGYPELKLRTGQSIVTGTPYVHSEVAADDPLTSVVDKVVDSSIYALTAMRRSLDQSVLDRVIGILATAPRIDCYGTGAARVLATEAQHKLMRFGIPVAAYDDTHLQRLAAASLRAGDVALCFSYTGRVRDTVAMARAARQCGATVVSITRPGTSLAAAADVVL